LNIAYFFLPQGQVAMKIFTFYEIKLVNFLDLFLFRRVSKECCIC
jgi:hypothetical protein